MPSGHGSYRPLVNSTNKNKKRCSRPARSLSAWWNYDQTGSLRSLSIYSIASLISNRQRFKEHTMALNTLDPQTALIIIDLQKAGFTMEWLHCISYFFGGFFLSN